MRQTAVEPIKKFSHYLSNYNYNYDTINELEQLSFRPSVYWNYRRLLTDNRMFNFCEFN